MTGLCVGHEQAAKSTFIPHVRDLINIKELQMGILTKLEIVLKRTCSGKPLCLLDEIWLVLPRPVMEINPTAFS